MIRLDAFWSATGLWDETGPSHGCQSSSRRTVHAHIIIHMAGVYRVQILIMLFSVPTRLISIQKHHPYTGILTSEMPGDSKNAFLG